MEADLDRYDEFKHPGNWGPELSQCTSDRMDRSVGYGVRAELLETAAGLVARQPGYFGQRGGYGFHLSVTALLFECAIIARMGPSPALASFVTVGLRASAMPIPGRPMAHEARTATATRPTGSIKVMCPVVQFEGVAESMEPTSWTGRLAGPRTGRTILGFARERTSPRQHAGEWHRSCIETS